MSKKEVFIYYLKFAFSVMWITGLFSKLLQIHFCGFESELQLRTILIDIVGWTITGFVYALILYAFYVWKLPKDAEQ